MNERIDNPDLEDDDADAFTMAARVDEHGRVTEFTHYLLLPRVTSVVERHEWKKKAIRQLYVLMRLEAPGARQWSGVVLLRFEAPASAEAEVLSIEPEPLNREDLAMIVKHATQFGGALNTGDWGSVSTRFESEERY